MKTRTRLGVETELAIRTDVATKIGQKTMTELQQQTKQATRTRLKTNLDLRTDINTPLKIPRREVPPVETPLKTKIGVMTDRDIKKKIGGNLFSVFVRRKGKFREIGKDLPYRKAFNIGRSIVAETPARTFRLVPKGGAISPLSAGSFDQMLRAPKGRSSLRAPLTFIEKARFGIDRPGEFAGITRKGIEASRNARRDIARWF